MSMQAKTFLEITWMVLRKKDSDLQGLPSGINFLELTTKVLSNISMTKCLNCRKTQFQFWKVFTNKMQLLKDSTLLKSRKMTLSSQANTKSSATMNSSFNISKVINSSSLILFKKLLLFGWLAQPIKSNGKSIKENILSISSLSNHASLWSTTLPKQFRLFLVILNFYRELTILKKNWKYLWLTTMTENPELKIICGLSSHQTWPDQWTWSLVTIYQLWLSPCKQAQRSLKNI